MIGERLRELRQQAGLTQAELAAPHYSHAYVSTIEAGKRNPSHEAISHFAERLGVPIDLLAPEPGLPDELIVCSLAARGLSALSELASKDPITYGRAREIIRLLFDLDVRPL